MAGLSLRGARSQNHGFAIDEATLPAELIAPHQSLFDQSLQGIMHIGRLAFGFQGHPESSPGPHDIQNIFDKFIHNLAVHCAAVMRAL